MKNWCEVKKFLFVGTFFLCAMGVNSNRVVSAAVMTFDIDQKLTAESADVTVQVTLDDETVPGSIKVTLDVLDPLADIRGFFLHVADESLLSGMSVDGDDVTDWEFAANSVINLGGGANLSGGGPASAGPFDVGVQIGTPGIGKDDIGMTMFTLSHDEELLDVGLILDEFIGIRLTSVGPEGNREGSSKLQGQIPPSPNPNIPEPASVVWLGGLGLFVLRRRF